MTLRFTIFRTNSFAYIHEMAHSHLASFFLMCVLFWIVAAAGFSGFIEKWGLRDGSERYGIIAMLDANAQKPYVYRQLIPMTVNFLDQYAPEKLKRYISKKNKLEDIFSQVKLDTLQKYPFKYICVCYFNFFSMFFSLFILRKILIEFGIGSLPSIVAPIAFVLCYPYLQTEGGYFYDGSELFFASLAFLLATRGHILLLVVLAIPATLNKESFFFMLPALYPLLRAKFPLKTTVTFLLAAILTAGIVNVLIKIHFSDVLGSPAEFYLFDNIKKYLGLYTYYQIESTYGIMGPSGAYFGTILVIAMIFIRGWPSCPKRLRQHILISACLNLPLFMLFCRAGELRNLSMIFVSFVILIGFAMHSNKLEMGANAPSQP